VLAGSEPPVADTAPKGLTTERVISALIKANGSPTEAAKLLGVKRGAIYYWMEKHQIEVNRTAIVQRGT